MNGRAEAQLIALACSEAPDGHESWTLRLLADKLVELGVVEGISHETVRQYLKKNELKPWQKKMWCIPKVDADFVAAMEAVLECYQQAYNPKEPVVCFDETSKQLIAETRIPLPMKVGQAMRYDYEYERRGTRNLPYHKTAPKCGTYCTQFVPNLIKYLGFI